MPTPPSLSTPVASSRSRLPQFVPLSQHAYELVRSHGESGATARLLPFTVDGLIWSPPPAPGPVSSRPL